MIDPGSLIENLWCKIIRRGHRLLDPFVLQPRGSLTPDRRPVRAIALYNGSDLAWGLNDQWVNKGVPWLLDRMQSAHQKGFQRFMWSLPAGRYNQENVPWPAAQWQILDDSGINLTVSGSVRQDLADIITPWLAQNPDVQVIVYLGGVIKSAYDRDPDGAWVPDPGCPHDLRIMHLNFDGFTALSPRGRHQIGFWFDNSSPAEKRKAEYRVIHWLRGQSLWGGMEAVANNNRISGDDSTNEPDALFVSRVPMFGLRHFFDPTVYHTPAGNAETVRIARSAWHFDPAKSEIGMFLHGYPEDDPHGLTLAQGEALLREYHGRGFILGTYVERWEEVIMEIISGG